MEVQEMLATVTRGPRYDSRRFEDAHGDAMPAYVVNGYVVEKNRRDWNHRVAGQSAKGWSGPKEWWEVRPQHSKAHPGCSVGRFPLFEGDTLNECITWIEENS